MSYWVAELTKDARMAYRRAQHDFGWGGSPGHNTVHTDIATEQAEAHARGISVRRDQLGLLKKATLLELIAAFRVVGAFAEKMQSSGL